MAKIAPERMAKVRAAWQEYRQQKVTGSTNLRVLEEKYEIPASTLSRIFKRFEAAELIAEKRVKGPEHPDMSVAVAQETMRQEYESKLAAESKDIIDTALSLGTIIVTRYRPQLEAFVAMGKSPDDMAIEVMSWYEQKLNLEDTMRKKEVETLELQRRIEEIAVYAKPNYIFEVKARLVRDFMVDILRARAMGISVNPKKAIEFYNKRLDYYQEQAELMFSPQVELGSIT